MGSEATIGNGSELKGNVTGPLDDGDHALRRKDLQPFRNWNSGMHRSNIICLKFTADNNLECFGTKYCHTDRTRLPFLDPVCKALFSRFPRNSEKNIEDFVSVAGDRGLLCVDWRAIGPNDGRSWNLAVFNICKFFRKQETCPEILPLPAQKHVNQINRLTHMRVDRSGDSFKILVAGNYTSDNSQGLSCFTEEYSSQTSRWEPVVCPNFVRFPDFFQNGAYYKDSKWEFLFCIALDTASSNSKGILMKYDFKKKIWDKCEVKLDTAETIGGSCALKHNLGDLNPSGDLQLLGVEECGGTIFLFSQQKYTNQAPNQEYVYFIIHMLQLDYSWKGIIAKPRPRQTRTLNNGKDGPSFITYQDTTCLPTEADIKRCDGCVYAFKLSSNLQDSQGEFVSIYDLINLDDDSASPPQWGTKEIKRIYKPRVPRAPNWIKDEDYLLEKLKTEASTTGVMRGGPTWNHVSEGMWMFGGHRRDPKSCQERNETLTKKQGQQQARKRQKSHVGAAAPELQDSDRFRSGSDSLKCVETCSGDTRSNVTNLTGSHSTVGEPSNAGGPSSCRAAPLQSFDQLQDSAWNTQLYEILEPWDNPSFENTSERAIGELLGDGGPSSPRAAPLEPAIYRQPSASNADELDFTTKPTSFDFVAPSPTTSVLALPASNYIQQPSAVNADLLRTPFNNQLDSFDGIYERAMQFLQRNGKQLTADQKRELIPRIDDLDVLKLQVKTANLREPESKFRRVVVNRLAGPDAEAFTESDCFEMLKKSLECDKLAYDLCLRGRT